MPLELLERDGDGEVLTQALRQADKGGTGSVVLVTGEAGIGKTSLVRAFLAAESGSARVLFGSCDDLLTPRPLGAIRDAVRDIQGPLSESLGHLADREELFRALVDELSRPGGPTVLVVEDVQWADDATLDLLAYLCRRLQGLRTMLVLTYRDDEVDPGHPLLRLLGVLASARVVRRLALHPLSRGAVERLGAGSGLDPMELFDVTGGNPFFVTESLALPEVSVPTSVVDAVLARVRRLDDATIATVEQLAMMPGGSEHRLVDALVKDRRALADAERHGVVVATEWGVHFRHELARRAVEHSMPTIRRRELHARVLSAMAAGSSIDAALAVHHGVAAGDPDAIVRWGPKAAREAAAAGSHRQALAHYETTLRFGDLLDADERAELLDAYAWELYNAHRFTAAMDVAEHAVVLRQQLGEPVALSGALVTLSRHRWLAGQFDSAQEAIDEAVTVASSTGRADARAHALSYRGALLALTDRPGEAMPELRSAHDLAVECGRADIEAVCLNYSAWARVDLGDAGGLDDVRASLHVAKSIGHDELIARGYTNLTRNLWRVGRFPEARTAIDEGLTFTQKRDFWSHAYVMDAHRCMLLMQQGEWGPAEDGLRRLLARVDSPGVNGRYTLPVLGRLLSRRGDSAAEHVLERAMAQAAEIPTADGIVRTMTARLEWAWLNDRVDEVSPAISDALPHAALPGYARERGELLRYMVRAGIPAEPFEGCPEEYAAGLEGDWFRAAALWESIGDPYDRALELADSGDADATLESLRVLEDLGAAAAGALVRRRLRRLGITRLPRGRQPATRANPGGLTDRQVEVLTLLMAGLTNAEIAHRLVLSVRTVDHHVSDVLLKLGAQSRRQAASIAADMGVVAEGEIGQDRVAGRWVSAYSAEGGVSA